MTRIALCVSLVSLVLAGCSEKKTTTSDDPGPSGTPAREVPAAGCSADFEELLEWAADILDFKSDYDKKYVRPPLDAKTDVKWSLTPGGVVPQTIDDKGKTTPGATFGYDELAGADLKGSLQQPSGRAILQLDNNVEWKDVVTAVGAVHNLGFAKVTLAASGTIQIPESPQPSSIRPQLVELANQDDRLFEEKDKAIIDTVFEHCPVIKDDVVNIKGPTRIYRFRGFLDLVKTGMHSCECRADLAEVKEAIWVRAMLTPYVVNHFEFAIAKDGDAAAGSLAFGAGDKWPDIKEKVRELHGSLNEKDAKPVTFSVAN